MKLISKKKGEAIAWNDADYVVQPIVNGERTWCKFYTTWKDMLTRAYSPKYHARRPTYIGTTICKEWHTFSVFRAWMEQQDWQGKALDKDIIIRGNKHYSPETCCFVSSKVNLLLNYNAASRGDLPLGVYLFRNKYRSQCSDGTGKNTILGLYDTPEQAHSAWRKFKITVIDSVIATLSDTRVIDGLNRHKALLSQTSV